MATFDDIYWISFGHPASILAPYTLEDKQLSADVRLRNDLYCVGWGVKLHTRCRRMPALNDYPRRHCRYYSWSTRQRRICVFSGGGGRCERLTARDADCMSGAHTARRFRSNAKLLSGHNEVAAADGERSSGHCANEDEWPVNSLRGAWDSGGGGAARPAGPRSVRTVRRTRDQPRSTVRPSGLSVSSRR